MARLTIAGRDFDIAPYKLGRLKQAAKFLDQINDRTGSLEAAANTEKIMENASDILQVLGIGTAKIDPSCNAEWLEEVVGFEDIPYISTVFTEVMRESGLAPKVGEAPGEAPAPAAQEAAGASLSE